MAQRFEPWHGSPPLPGMFGGINVVQLSNSAVVLHLYANDGLLRITFPHSLAIMSHDDVSHPDCATDAPRPRLAVDPSWTHPLLEVHDSLWKASFRDSEFEDWAKAHRHFQFISQSATVDVLSRAEPTALWLRYGDEDPWFAAIEAGLGARPGSGS